MLDRLPSEIVFKIFSSMSITEILPSTSVSKALNEFIHHSPVLWSRLIFSEPASLNTSRSTRTKIAFQTSFTNFIRGLKICTEKSRNGLQVVSINFKIGFGSDYIVRDEHSVSVEDDVWKEIFDSLTLSGKSLRVLHLTLPQNKEWIVFNWLQNRFTLGQFNGLRKLSMQNVPLKSNFCWEPHSSEPPSLQYLSIFSAQFIHRFDRLRYLDLSVFQPSQSCSSFKELLLLNSSSLETLSIGHSVLSDFLSESKKLKLEGKESSHQQVELPKLKSLSLSPRSPSLSKIFTQNLHVPNLQVIQGDVGSLAGLISTPSCSETLRMAVVWLDGSSSGGGGIKELQKSLVQLEGVQHLELKGRPERKKISQIDGLLRLLCRKSKKALSQEGSQAGQASTKTQDFRTLPKMASLNHLQNLTLGENLLYSKMALMEFLHRRAEAGIGLKLLSVGMEDLNPIEVRELKQSGVVGNLKVTVDE